MSSTNIGQSTFKYVILVFVILAIVIVTLIVTLGSTKSKFTDQNANSNPQLNISASQLAIASYVGIGLLVIAGVAILAISLRPRV